MDNTYKGQEESLNEMLIDEPIDEIDESIDDGQLLDDTDFEDIELDDTGDIELDGLDDIELDSTDDLDSTDNLDSIELDSADASSIEFDDTDNLDSIELDNTDDELMDESIGDNLEEIGDTEDANEIANTEIDDDMLLDDSGLEENDISDEKLVNNSEDTDKYRSQQSVYGFLNSNGDIIVQDADDTNEKGFEIVYIDIDKIVVAKRIRDMHSVDGLVQSIKSTGLLQPLIVAHTVTNGIYVLLDGFRRLQACARAGLTRVPCVINKRVSTPEIPIVEAMYNHSKEYSIQEKINYIQYLEEEKGIRNSNTIEYLLQMNNGDYTKLKDILSDNDDDIVTKLYDGIYDISTAFKKLEQRRKKESAEEKDDKRAARVYNDEESGIESVSGTGEETDGNGLTDEQIQKLYINPDKLDEEVEGESLDEMIADDKNMEGFKPHKQKAGDREYIDPIIKKTVMTRDKSTCQCCKRGGEQYVDILDYHHILPVFLGGKDTPENGIMLCVACHRLVHLYSTDDLHIDEALIAGSYNDLSEEDRLKYGNEQIYEDEKKRFKRIIKLGSAIRKGIVAKGMNRDKYKKEHSNNNIGRRKPGINAEQEEL